MDGPNVNWKMFKDFSAELDKGNSHQLVNIGSCGLHVIHNAFKDGVQKSDWDTSVLLRSVFFLFQESPARREDFSSVTGSTSLPLQFCGHRWLENLAAAQRLISIWPAIKTYIQACKNGKTSEPLCKSYKVVSDFISDKLIIAKLHCFSYLASILQPFLQKYQTNDPVAVYLTDDLFTIIKRLYFLILKDEAIPALSLDGSLHPSKQDKSAFKQHTSISLGSAAELEVKALKGKAVSDLDVMKLKMSFQKFVISIISKIVDKSPIRYSFARDITCLNPYNFHKEDAQKKFDNVVNYLRTRRWLSDEQVDSAKFEYSVLRKSHKEIEVDGKRLDETFRSIKELNTMPSLMKVINISLCLSHGNAEVERGFSINKEVSVDNMSEECLIAKRLSCQFIRENGEPANISFSKSLLISCSGAYQRYKKACEEKRDALEKEEKQSGIKRKHEEAKELQSKKRRLEVDIEQLIKKADDLSEEAEGHASLKKAHNLLVQSNALRKEAKTKKADLACLSASLQTLEGELSV